METSTVALRRVYSPARSPFTASDSFCTPSLLKRASPSDSVALPVALVTQTYTFYEREQVTRTAEDVRVDMLSRALGETAADIDGMVTSHSETLTEQNGAAVLHLTVHAEEQIGTEAVDDSTVPEEGTETEQVP